MGLREELMNLDLVLYKFVDCTANNEEQQIRKASRKRSFTCRPDYPNSAKRFSKLNTTVEIWRDKLLRSCYGRRVEARIEALGAEQCTADDCRVEVCTAEVCRWKDCTAEVCRSKDCTAEVCRSKDCTAEVWRSKDCTAEVWRSKDCTAEVCPAEDCTAEVCPAEDCTAEVCRVENSTAKFFRSEDCTAEVCQTEDCTAEVCQTEDCTVEVCQTEVCEAEEAITTRLTSLRNIKEHMITLQNIKVPGDVFGGLKHILQLREPSRCSSAGNINIDFKTLQLSTLRDLDLYLEFCLHKGHRKQPYTLFTDSFPSLNEPKKFHTL